MEEVHRALPTAKEEVLVCSLQRKKYLVHSTWHLGPYITLSEMPCASAHLQLVSRGHDK